MSTNTKIKESQQLHLYQLNDSITKLNLLTQFQTAKPLSDFEFIPKTKNNNQITIGHLPYTIKRDDTSDITSDVFDTQSFIGRHPSLETQRRVVYEVGQELIRSNIDETLTNDISFNSDNQMDGQFLIETRSVLINAGNHGLYYLIPKSKQDFNSVNHLNFKLYHAEVEQSDDLVISILHQNANERFRPNLNAFNALKEFWLAQVNVNQNQIIISDENNQPDRNQNSINQALTQIFEHVLADQKGDKTNFNINLTFNEIIQFYNEIQNRKLTKATQNVQDWLFGDETTTSSINDLLKLLALHQNFDTIKQQIEIIQPNQNKEIKTIIAELKKDRYFPKFKDMQIQIYALNNQPKDYDEHAEHFMGVHGTNACSIPTILCDGLKSNIQLRGDKDAQYLETAQGLGDGTYFARLDQASKALNYAGDENRNYLMIADVAYTHPVKAKNYVGNQVSKHPYDFVEGIEVGNLHNYDEYVAVNPQKQVTLKYLIEITKDIHENA